MTRDKQIDPLKGVSSFVSHLLSEAGVNWICPCLPRVEKQHVVVKPTCKLEHFTDEPPKGSKRKLLEVKHQKSKRVNWLFFSLSLDFFILFQVVSCLNKIFLASPCTVERSFMHKGLILPALKFISLLYYQVRL